MHCENKDKSLGARTGKERGDWGFILGYRKITLKWV